MFLTQRLQEGVCGLYRHRHSNTMIVRFYAEKVPFLEVWMSNGGWLGDAAKNQFAMTLEPTTAMCGSLNQACAKGLIPMQRRN